jgi:hypothetical protein
MKRRERRIGNGALERNRVGAKDRARFSLLAGPSYFYCYCNDGNFKSTALGGLLERCPLKDRIPV